MCGDLFMMTDGSDGISFRDDGFSVVRRLSVRTGKHGLRGLNDLEYAGGRIYANSYYDDFIYEISPGDGQVTRVVDCTGLARSGRGGNHHRILNGIAYSTDRGTFFVTGKNWDRIFEISIQRPDR